MEEEKKIPNNTKTSEHIKKISQKLRDKQYLCDPDIGDVFEIFDEFYREGESDSVIFDTLCDNLPDLRGISTADEEELLRELKAEKKRQKWQRINSDAFLLDDKGRRRVNYEGLIDNLITEYTFKTLEDTEQVLVYENGIYKNAKVTIRAYCEKVLGSLADWHIVNEIAGHVQRRTYTPRNVFNADKRYIPVLNGLLNLETLQLEEFDTEKAYTFRLPVEYNPDAGYSHIKGFFKEVLHAQDIDAMQEVFGYVLYPQYPAHKMFWWLAPGRNGKSTTSALLTALVGVENTANVPLKQLDGEHRFAPIRLFGKLANIVAEPGIKSSLLTETLKQATGGDFVDGERKGIQEGISFQNFAKFIIYANKVPQILDESIAFWDRVIAINFPNEFRGNNAKKDHSKTIIEQDGVSGLLNWALVGLKRLRENNWEFTETESQKEAKVNMMRESQPVNEFIDEWTEFNNRAEIPKDELFNAFKIYCDVYGLLVPPEGDFTRDLKRSARVRATRPKLSGKRVLCWQGLKIRDNVEVAISHEKNEEVPIRGIRGKEERNIELETYPLADYVAGQGGQGGHTFSTSLVLGERIVILENKEYIPLCIGEVGTPMTGLTGLTKAQSGEQTAQREGVSGLISENSGKTVILPNKESIPLYVGSEKTLDHSDQRPSMRASCETCGKMASLVFYKNRGLCQECIKNLKEIEKAKTHTETKDNNNENPVDSAYPAYGNTKCPICGKDAVLIFYNNQDVCSSCLRKLKKEDKKKKTKLDKPTKTVNIDDINEDGSIKPGALDKKQEVGELETVIKSFVIDATKEDDRGAMTVAMANRIANDFLYETAEVKAAIDRLVQDGKLLLSEYDYGKYVKVVCEDGCCELTKFIPSPNLDEDECSRCGEVKMCEWQIEEEGEWLPICQSCKLIIQEQER